MLTLAASADAPIKNSRRLSAVNIGSDEYGGEGLAVTAAGEGVTSQRPAAALGRTLQYASPIGGCTRVGGKHGMLGTSLRPCPYG
jgi:hypothetical protein